jgi:hypothetical protein
MNCASEELCSKRMDIFKQISAAEYNEIIKGKELFLNEVKDLNKKLIKKLKQSQNLLQELKTLESSIIKK